MLNVLLAVTDQLKPQFKNMVKDFQRFFANKQGAFVGERRTYVPRDGFTDEATKRGYTEVATSVDEKLDWFMDHSEQFINSIFAQEKTNSSGLAKAKLTVDGKVWGEFTSLELLKLKSLIESADLGSLSEMISRIPVRSDREIWSISNSEQNLARDVYETPIDAGEVLTTIKEPVILEDPNLRKREELPANYTSIIVSRDKTVAKGDYTVQKFSGEWSQRQRAEALSRRNTLLVAVQEALKTANSVAEIIPSELTSKKIFGYIFDR